jgi:hypothetical protein
MVQIGTLYSTKGFDMVHTIVLQGPEGIGDSHVTTDAVIGRLGFVARDPDGTYATLVVGKIEAVAEEAFTSSENQTRMVFSLAADGTASSKMTLSSAGTLTLAGSLVIAEGSDHAQAPVADYGQVWVKTAVPNELYFTNDAGNDIQITSGSSMAGGGAGASLTGNTDNQVVTVTGSDAIAGETRLTFDGDALAVTTLDENKVPVTINGAANQASDLLQIKNSAGNTLFVVDAIGQVGIGESVDPAAGKLLHISGGTTDGNKTMIFEAGSTGGGDTDNQAIMKLVAGTSANVQIQMGHGTGSSTLKGAIKYKSDDSLVLRANSADSLTIAAEGDVTFAKAIKPALEANSDGSTVTFNLNEANVHTVTLGVGVGDGTRTFAISNETAGQKFIIRILQDGTGSRTVTWFSTIKWAGGSAPTLTTTPSKADVVGFIVTGTDTYDGFVVGQNI